MVSHEDLVLTRAKSTRKWPTVFVLLFLKGTTGRAMKRNKEHLRLQISNNVGVSKSALLETFGRCCAVPLLC